VRVAAPPHGAVTGGTALQLLGLDFPRTPEAEVHFRARPPPQQSAVARALCGTLTLASVAVRGVVVSQGAVTVVTPDFSAAGFKPGEVEVRGWSAGASLQWWGGGGVDVDGAGDGAGDRRARSSSLAGTCALRGSTPSH
jgi:hypothetical protein